MLYQDIFTIPDDSLYKEGSLDPMGVQAIWSKFGQEIFHNKLNTISTDIRNYTINLFHHSLIRKLCFLHADTKTMALQKFSNYKKDYDLKTGLIIFLEDILVGILVNQKTKNRNVDIDLSGILGSYKAEWKLNSSESYILKADRNEGGFLVRQILLGINGRYKGPFINMSLFDSAFRYTDKNWEEVDKMFESWPEAKGLQNILMEKLLSLIKHESGSYPKLDIKDFLIDPYLTKLYTECFGNRNVPNNVKSYWEDKLGLHQGAVNSLYNQFQESIRKTPKEYYLNARQNEKDEHERRKLEHIIDLETFLSPCLQIFYLLTKKSVNNIHALEKEVEAILPIETTRIEKFLHYNVRLNLLAKAIEKSKDHPLETIKEIVDYHQNVMQQKGAMPWVRIIKNGRLEHLIYQDPLYSTEKFINEKPWYNNYYISTLKSIYLGLNPSNDYA